MPSPEFVLGVALAYCGLLFLVHRLLFRRRKPYRDPWWDEYRAFLRSAEWQCIRYRKLCQSGFRCQVNGCSSDRLQVHHLSYRRYREGHLEDLMVLCREHHQGVHGRMFHV